MPWRGRAPFASVPWQTQISHQANHLPALSEPIQPSVNQAYSQNCSTRADQSGDRGRIRGGRVFLQKMFSVNHLVAFEIQGLQQMRCVSFHSQSWIILAPNDLGREFSRLQSGLDAVLKGGGPFEAPHDLEERSSAIGSQEELTVSSGLCSVDVARTERFIENIKHRSSRGL